MVDTPERRPRKAGFADVLGRTLRAWRERRGLNQKQLAIAIGIPASTLSKWERGIQAVPVAELRKLADALKVDLEILVPSDGRMLPLHQLTQRIRELSPSEQRFVLGLLEASLGLLQERSG